MKSPTTIDSHMLEQAQPAVATKEVTVVVPCYNEAETMGFLAEKLREMEAEAPNDVRFRYLLVDDGSTDRTWEMMHEHFGHLPEFKLLQHERNSGIMAALKTGIRAAETEWVATIDADCTFDPVKLLDLIEQAKPGVDVVVGSPYHPAGGVENVPAWRLGLSKGASVLYTWLMKTRLYSYTSCFRVYRRSSLEKIEVESNGFVGMAEILWRLDQQGARMVEVPAVLNVRRYGQSKMRTMQVIGEHLGLMRQMAFSRR
jgi:dolichol-phosphate mannosyltransferase